MSDEHASPIPEAGRCGDAPLYLLGLLDERDSEAFLEHARSCALCGDDLTALAPAVERLPATVPRLSAPGHVKRQVMTAVRSEASQATRSPLRSGRARRRPAPRRGALALAGAGLLAAGVAIGGLSTPFGGGSARVGGGSAQAGGGTARAGGGTALVVSANVTLAGAGAALHESGGHAWLTISKLPEPSSGHVYEVWLKRPGRAAPQPTDSLFTPTASGAATVDVPGGGGAGEVLVTQEPAGGSPLPTGPVLIVARLTRS